MTNIQERLQNFSDKFNEASPLFSHLNAEGVESIKEELMISMVNFSKRAAMSNAATGMGGADIFENIGKIVTASLENSSGLPTNFSNDLGGIQSKNIGTLLIQSQYSSYALGYIANTFGMNHPTTQYNFQSLVAKNEFGIFHSGDTVIDQRRSSNPLAQITGDRIISKEVVCAGADILDASINFGFPLRINSVTVQVLNADNQWEVIGYDVKSSRGEGVIAQKSKFADKVNIDYRTGIITVTNPSAVAGAQKIKVVGREDITKNDKGQPPTLMPMNDHIVLEAKQNFFTLEQNLEDIVRMNKEYRINTPNGIASSYAKNTISQLMSFFIKSIDADIMTTLVESYLPYILSLENQDAFDLSDWENSGNTNLLETRMVNFIRSVDQYMSGIADGRRITAIIADTVGVVTLMSNRFFKSYNNGMGYSDGIVGELDGIKIIRSRVLDAYFSPSGKYYDGKENVANVSETMNNIFQPESNEQISVMFCVHKDQANKAAPVVHGLYLPCVATQGQMINNGTSIVHTIQTDYASQLVLPNLCMPVVTRVSGSKNLKPIKENSILSLYNYR